MLSETQTEPKGISASFYADETLVLAAKSQSKELGESFSAYIEKLIRADLAAAGKLPGTPSAESARLAAELSRPGKPAEIVAAKLREAAVEIARLVQKEVA